MRCQFPCSSAVASGIETLRWYGLGNDTEAGETSDFYKVDHDEVTASLRVGRQLSDRTRLSIGPQIR